MIILLAIILFSIALLLDLAKKWAIGQKVCVKIAIYIEFPMCMAI